jgi:hypothetical protein
MAGCDNLFLAFLWIRVAVGNRNNYSNPYLPAYKTGSKPAAR